MIQPEEALNHVNPYSKPSDLRITDMRFTDILGAPFHSSLIKIYTNQGLVGLGEVRDIADKQYALMLKSRILGENPCNVDKIFRRIKQFGGFARQGGGVSGIEVALWDLAGKAYGVPVYQMLGGKFRDQVRLYCDTDVGGKINGKIMGEALKKRMERGFTFLKMDLGISLLYGEEGTISAPLGFIEKLKDADIGLPRVPKTMEERVERNRAYDVLNIPHPLTGVQLTEKGLDVLEQYMADVRSIIGDQVPLAIDHLGHINVESVIRLARRLEKYHPAWLEDPIPWQYTDQYVRLSNSTAVPICTGEDIYLKENFRPLLEKRGVSVIHPDILTTGGILETKKIGDMAYEYGVAMAIHMAEGPVACMAAAHVAVATENFLALEFHAADVPWWNDIVVGLPNIVQNGFITVPDKPGLGIDDFDDEVLKEHIHPDVPGLWEPTDEWNGNLSHDRIWS
ncbi:MAG: mandelate racemase/muconate lactonizing enzyme family protein [Firmicutes bacterium]|nr:mandelate racemase/muconate lactonizing enzyme family protein [Bacillota bacterium]